MIVDKKAHMLNYEKMLHWEDYQFQIATVTNQADRAIAYYGEYQYKLVITSLDFSGNVEEGLSLIKIIKSLNPLCQIIVISDQTDFYTVRKAFMNGANDFLKRQDLRYIALAEALQRARLNIKTDESSDNKQLTKMLGLIRDGQKVDERELLSYLRREQYPLLYGEWQLVYFRMDNVRHINRNLRNYETKEYPYDASFIELFQQRIQQREQLQDDLLDVIEVNVFVEHHVIFTKKHSGLIIIRPMKREVLMEKCHGLLSRMVNCIHYTFSMTISSIGCGIQDFLPSYHQVIDYHRHKFYENDFCVLNVEDQKHYQHFIEMQPELEETILLALTDRERLQMAIETILETMLKQMVDPDDVKRYMIKLIHKILKEGHFGKQLEEEQLHNYEQGVWECESISFMRYELYRIFSAIALLQGKEEKRTDYVEQILSYIERHLDQKISLPLIAKEIGINETYAGRLFKKAKGLSIVSYVHEQRMEKAAFLLVNTDLKIRDIAVQVGMQDQLYFNKMFRKYFGKSPSEYRKQNGLGKL